MDHLAAFVHCLDRLVEEVGRWCFLCGLRVSGENEKVMKKARCLLDSFRFIRRCFLTFILKTVFIAFHCVNKNTSLLYILHVLLVRLKNGQKIDRKCPKKLEIKERPLRMVRKSSKRPFQVALALNLFRF